MVPCNCKDLPPAFYSQEVTQRWIDSLEKLASGNWKDLVRCPACAQLFAKDVVDKYGPQILVRINDHNRWEELADDPEVRKEVILRKRGGTQSAICMWIDCDTPRVKDSAYCVDHLWHVGSR